MRRCLLLVLVTIFMYPSLARGTEASGSSEKLLGWSEDGKTWAVLWINESGGEQELRVVTAGGVVLTLCSQDEDDSGTCERSKTTKVVNLTSTEKYSAMERINIEKHKYLKAFKLKRIKGKWRKDFKKSFKLESADTRESWNDNKCKSKWRILSRADKTEVASHKVKAGCLSSKGGYLHPTGKYALIKQEHSTWSTSDEDAGFWTDDAIEYVLVPVKTAASVKN